MEIYRIVNKENGKSYVGRSLDSKKRFSSHIRESKLERYKNRKLSIAIREFGEESFLYEVLEITDDPKREKYWVSFFDSYNNGYNHTKDGRGNVFEKKYNVGEKITSEMIDVAVNSYMERPSLRIAAKKSMIPERKLRSILNERIMKRDEEIKLFEKDETYLSIDKEIKILKIKLKNLNNRLYKRKVKLRKMNYENKKC